jgi:hypothetical protein
MQIDPTVVLAFGGLVLVIGIIVGSSGYLAKGLIGVGGAVMLTAALVQPGTVIPFVPTPVVPVVPDPIVPPTPPTPQTSLTGIVQGAFQQDGGTSDQAKQLAAVFLAQADMIQWDGQRNPPKITNTMQFGVSFNELQRYFWKVEARGGFINLKNAIGNYLTTERLVSEDASQPLDRTKAVSTFQEVGNALSTL